MALLGECTVKLNYEMTDVSRNVLKALIADCLRDALTGTDAVFPTEDELRAFVQAEVRKALQEPPKPLRHAPRRIR